MRGVVFESGSVSCRSQPRQPAVQNSPTPALLRGTPGIFEASGSLRQKQVCDALRCSGPHARYTDACNEFFCAGGGRILSSTPSLPWPRGPGTLVNLHRDGARSLQLWIFNEECLVGVGHQPASITSLPFVHTARRFYRLDAAVKTWDWSGGPAGFPRVPGPRTRLNPIV